RQQSHCRFILTHQKFRLKMQGMRNMQLLIHRGTAQVDNTKFFMAQIGNEIFFLNQQAKIKSCSGHRYHGYYWSNPVDLSTARFYTDVLSLQMISKILAKPRS